MNWELEKERELGVEGTNQQTQVRKMHFIFEPELFLIASQSLGHSMKRVDRIL